MVGGRRIVVVGAGEHATSVAETAVAAGFEIVAFVGQVRTSPTKLGVPIVPAVPADHLAAGGVLVVAEGDNQSRRRVAESLSIPDDRLAEVCPPLVHPSASVSRFAVVGPGTVVLQGAVVGSAATVGRFCIVNTRASIDHDCVVDDFASIAPGATLGGAVRVGGSTAIGIGAVVKHGVTIGADTVVGASSYVHRDLPDRVVAYGVPARTVRTREPGDPYLA